MKSFNTNTQNDENWLTPPKLLKILGPFDLDPCAPENRIWNTARNHFTKADDGLSQKWSGRVWLNPPYGRQTFKWLDKLATHRDGIALVFARTETQGFHDTVWQKAESVFFFKGRIAFFKLDGTQGGAANAPSCLVTYDQANTKILEQAIAANKLVGKLLLLR